MSFDFAMHKMPPTKKAPFGEIRIVDSSIFPISTAIAAVHVIVKPGGLRELHWPQNADEWQYYIQGQGRMTVFFNGAKARTADLMREMSDISLGPSATTLRIRAPRT